MKIERLKKTKRYALLKAMEEADQPFKIKDFLKTNSSLANRFRFFFLDKVDKKGLYVFSKRKLSYFEVSSLDEFIEKNKAIVSDRHLFEFIYLRHYLGQAGKESFSYHCNKVNVENEKIYCPELFI